MKKNISDTGFYNNNFDFLRLLAAFFVFLSHCFSVYGFYPNGEFFDIFHEYSRYESLGGIGLSFFFVISGFLVCSSLEKTDSVFFFVIKRLLRLMPALFLVVLLTVFVLGPIMTSLSVGEYFNNPQTYTYLLNILIYPVQYHLPYVFMDAPLKNMVNLHLWSLPIETSMYVVLLILYLCKLINIKLLLPLIILLLAIYSQFVQFDMSYEEIKIMGMKRTYLVKYGFMFFSGVLLYKIRHKTPVNGYIFVLCCFIIFITLGWRYSNIYIAIAIPYIVYYIAYANLGNNIMDIAKYGDFSYGFYLYSFPIHQIFAQIYGQKIDFMLFIVLTFIITLICAIASYYIIEQPALNLKNVIKKRFF